MSDDAGPTTRPGAGPVVADDEAAHRFRITVDGRTAGFAEYTMDGGAQTFTHTVIKPDFEGRGLGSTLIRAALDAARTAGHQVLPQCSFVRHYLVQHPGDLDLVPVDRRSEFDLPDR
jgi:predicted GNAT family acetyltransferase